MHRFLLLLLAGLLLAVPATAHGQGWEDYDYENLEFRGLSVDLGWVTPSRVDHTLMLGLRADLGYLGPNLRIAPGLTYWSSELRRSEIDRLADQIRSVCLQQHQSLQCPPLDLGDVRMSDLAVNLDGMYEFPNTPFVFTPYVGTGGSLHFLNSRGDLINDTFIEDFLDSLTPGLNLFGGIRIPLAEHVELLAEARYMLASEIRYGTLSAGASWLFPARGAPVAPRTIRGR